MKTEFKDVFSEIPHIDELPTDIYCWIKLKDMSKTIQTWTYSTPRKYHEAWATLIQQHLDASWIRPSNSSHASPTFLIPKSDTVVLPQPLSCSKLPLMVPCHNHTLCLQLVFCLVLGAYQSYLLHLPDLFLMLWLVNNLVEFLFVHQPPGYLSISSTRLSAVVLVFYISSTCFILEVICICAALQWSDRSVFKSASQHIIPSMLNHPCCPLVHPWLSPLPVMLTNPPHVFQMS
jgi:hypothetical protein